MLRAFGSRSLSKRVSRLKAEESDLTCASAAALEVAAAARSVKYES
jgi:hypothetical protein